jgi:peptide-methionine (S)-S-oxide reductase
MNMTRRLALLFCLLIPALAHCEPKKLKMPASEKAPAEMPKVPEGMEAATVAGGCFWCVEAVYKRVDGVISVTSGYTGGKKKNPTYEDINRHDTGHAEAVMVVFDPKKITYERVLAWFWDAHDPTTLNRQGNDVGDQYRSAIYYTTEEQKKIAEASKAAAAANFKDPIVTEITKLGDFYPAENYHQNYYAENKSKNPYCKYVIEPKLKKLKLDP